MSDYIVNRYLLPNGTEVSIMPLTFGRARLVVSDYPGSEFVSDGW